MLATFTTVYSTVISAWRGGGGRANKTEKLFGSNFLAHYLRFSRETNRAEEGEDLNRTLTSMRLFRSVVANQGKEMLLWITSRHDSARFRAARILQRCNLITDSATAFKCTVLLTVTKDYTGPEPQIT